MNTQNTLRNGHKIGIFLVLLFVVCFAWFYVQPAEKELHARLFKLSYLWLTDMGTTGFILGALQTYVWGYIAAFLWTITKKLS